MDPKSFNLFYMVFGAFYNVAWGGVEVNGGHQVSCSPTLCLIPLGSGPSLNLKLDWQPAAPVTRLSPSTAVWGGRRLQGQCQLFRSSENLNLDPEFSQKLKTES